MGDGTSLDEEIAAVTTRVKACVETIPESLDVWIHLHQAKSDLRLAHALHERGNDRDARETLKRAAKRIQYARSQVPD